MRKQSLLFLLLLTFVLSASAQTSEKKWGIGLYGGVNEYNGDYGNDVFRFSNTKFFLGQISVARYLNPSFDLGLQGNYGSYGHNADYNTTNKFDGTKTSGGLFLHYKLNNGYIFSKDSKISPFLSTGIGVAQYAGKDIDSIGMDLMIPIGIGVKYQFCDWFAMQYKFSYNLTNHDNHDTEIRGKYNDDVVEQTLGIVFNFGGKSDSDKDGVVNKLDKCPNTPAGVKVDSDGCPIDSDKDGIADYLDKCPTVFGIAAFEGCPDTDRDGIQDSEDKCPTIAGIAQFQGCPDTDGDGIPDYEDRCPTEAGLAQFKGCPDTDGDGIPDIDDRCPKVSGSKILKGCPDRDNDGIADIDDKCPDVAGIVANKGCPEIKEETKKIFEQALQGIQFESGKDIIKKNSFGILDKVVKVMLDNPSYFLEINGHTDSQGDDASNLTLSQERSNAVKNYLANKGVDASRTIAIGHGETTPVEDNATPAGRAKNRRVEFKVLF